MRGRIWYKLVLGCLLCLCVAGAKAETLFSCMYHQSVTGGVRLYNTTNAAFLSSLGTELAQIQGIAFAPDGTIYVSDGFNNKIVRYNASGQFMDTLISDPNKVNMDGAQGLAFGPDGMLYVGSFWNSRILKYHPTTGAFLGIFAQGGVFDKPMNMVFRPDGVLYVACYQGGVLRYNATTGAALAPIATDILQADSLLFINGKMYVTDYFSDRLMRYDTPSSVGVPVISGFADRQGFRGMVLDAQGQLYLACFWSKKILRYNFSTFQLIDTFATGDAFFSPTTLAFNSSGSGGATNTMVSGVIGLESSAALNQVMHFEFRPRPSGTAFTRTQTLSSSGAFSFGDIPRSDYDVAIKGAKWLRKVVRVNASAGDVTNVQAVLRTGDANDDNAIDINDLTLLIAHYNKVSPSQYYADACDFNSDGSNDINDLLLLIAHYNQLGE